MTVIIIPGNLFQVYSYQTALSEKQGGDLTRSKPSFSHSALILRNVTAALDRLHPQTYSTFQIFLFECDVTFCVYLLSTNDKKYVLV